MKTKKKDVQQENLEEKDLVENQEEKELETEEPKKTKEKKMVKGEKTKKADKKKDEDEDEEEVSMTRRVLNTVINTILVVAMVFAAICTYVSFVSSSGSGVPSILGVGIFSIQTDSMYPEMAAGDMVISSSVKDPASLETGDVITYWTVISGERVLNTHRITEIFDGGDYLLFQTKGDNNTIEDSLTVHESEIVGKYKFKIPGIGKMFDYLQTSTGFLLVVVVPVLLFFLFHLVQFFRVLFEYQNVKNRIKYEKERGKTEDLLSEKEKQLAIEKEKQRKELEDKLRAELLAEIKKEDEEKQSAEEKQKAEEAKKAEEERLKKEAEEKLKAELKEQLRQEILAEQAKKDKE